MNNECKKTCIDHKANCINNKKNPIYIKRIIKLIGPVILGSKPAEIINVPGSIEEKKIKINLIESFFSNCARINYIIINKKDGGKRILFINEESMSKCLENKKRKNFLKFIGYPSEYNLEVYINELVKRLNSDKFPDEIGIFLGYPVKDVLGFMGYGKQEFSCVYSWRVYGNKDISYKTYNQFVKDKQKMEVMVDNLSIRELKNVI